MTTKRCEKCGNLIPTWAHGVCPRCVLIEQDEKRYGQRSRPRYGRRPRPLRAKSPYQSRIEPIRPSRSKKIKPTALSQKWETSPSKAPLKQASLGLRLRLEGFNRLLKDVYGKKVWLGHLLLKQGISQEQVELWREDGVWLLGFLKRLEQKLLADLTKAGPGQDPRVLSRWYGLSSPKARSVKAIAFELGITPFEVNTAHKTLLRYLCGKAGRMALEKAVVMATRENN
jgi:hypothetical protein